MHVCVRVPAVRHSCSWVILLFGECLEERDCLASEPRCGVNESLRKLHVFCLVAMLVWCVEASLAMCWSVWCDAVAISDERIVCISSTQTCTDTDMYADHVCQFVPVLCGAHPLVYAGVLSVTRRCCACCAACFPKEVLRKNVCCRSQHTTDDHA